MPAIYGGVVVVRLKMKIEKESSCFSTGILSFRVKGFMCEESRGVLALKDGDDNPCGEKPCR